MIKKIALLPLLFLSTFVSMAQNDLVVKGILTNNTEHKIVYLENILSQKDLDSSAIEQTGSFTLKTKIEKSDFYS